MKTEISITDKQAGKGRRFSPIPILLASLAVIAISPAGAQGSDSSASSSGPPTVDPTGGSTVWTAPKYAVKEIKSSPAQGASQNNNQDGSQDSSQGQSQGQSQDQSNSSQPAADNSQPSRSPSGIIRRHRRRSSDANKANNSNSGSADNAGSGSGKAASGPAAFDEKAFRTFVDSLKEPQYVWLSPDRSSAAVDPKNAFKQTKTLANADQLGAMDSYIKDLTTRVQANLSVPSTATLVESNLKYSYLITFTIREKGQIANFQVEKQIGPFTTVPLADDNESASVVQAINNALTKATPMPTPPVGFAPWYMVLQYDVNSGRMILACLNSR